MANFAETTQATDNMLESYDRVKSGKNDPGKQVSTDLGSGKRAKHSFTPGKIQRDIFGATILPSNLSFDNMKKLSMNQIKLKDIPLVDENETAEALASEKMSRVREAEESSPFADHGEAEEREIDSRKKRNDAKTDPYEDIPGPRLFESVTSTLKYTARHATVYFLLRLLRNGSTDPFRKYGPMVRLPEIMGGRILLVNRSEHVLAIHEQDKRNPASSSLDTLECSRLRRHGRRKLPSLSEKEWEKTREAINGLVAREEENYFDGLEESGSRLIRRIRAVKSRENEVTDDFDCEINKWSLECIFKLLFDKSPDFLDPETMKWPSKNAQLLAYLREATRSLNQCENGLQLWRFMNTSASVSLDHCCQAIETILSDHVYQAQKDLLKRTRRTNQEEDSLSITNRMLQDGLTKTEVVTNHLDTLLIGMNAITNTMSFLLYHLAKNPRTQNELLTEIKEIMPEKYSRLEYDHLSSLKYLSACLRETLRLKMPIPLLTRYLDRDVILSNFQIPRGTFVVMAAQAEALKEENFEGSKEFRPGRWLQSENKLSLPSIPLSAHSRNLFEARLAAISIMASVAQIIRNFNVEFNYGQLTSSTSPLSHPTKPLKFSFLEREA